MSGLAAIIRFDGGAVEPGAIEKMTRAMRYRGADGIRHWTSGPIALGHCMLHTTAESLEEVQPLVHEEGSLALVMDGWLSNPDELRKDLLTRGVRLRTRSDAELVLRAFEVWGDDCPKHIDGEYALVIWDARRKEAFVTNDHIGLKPLHYQWDGNRLIVASDIVGVLAGPDVRQEPNLPKIAEFLAYEMIDRNETVWSGVMRALPAHWMRFGRKGMQAAKYWEPPLEARIRYARDEEYFEHYREVFTETVRRSSRTHLPLACDVSGGLDSSAVFAMAHDLRRKGRLPAPEGVKGYTYFFKDAEGADHDEIAFARAVASHTGEYVREVAPFLPDPSWFFERGKMDQNIAGYPNGVMSIAIGKALVEDGCRVILNGEGGDEWLAGNRFYYWEHLAQRDWRGLVRTFREDAASIGLGISTIDLVRCGLAQFLPRPILDLRHSVRKFLGSASSDTARCLSPQLDQLLEARRAAGRETNFLNIRNLAHRAMLMVLTDPRALVTWDQTARQSARIGYEIRTPMYSRAFIEFAFATPERIRLRGNTGKYLHIKALSDLLPVAVSNRKTKADFAIAFLRNLNVLGGALTDILRESQTGYLDARKSAMLYERLSRDPVGGRLMWQLWSMLEIESLFGHKVVSSRLEVKGD